MLSIAAPFNRAASFPSGQVTVRDVAGLYIYDNTLLAVKVTGAQVKDYLEYSARYFRQVSGTGPFPMSEVTNAVTDTAPNGTPDYNFDSVAGLDAPLTYDIDLSQPVGSRIRDLAYGGTPVGAGQEFALAVNNYRQSGGGGFPHVSHRSGRLQPAERDPPAAHRLGDRPPGHRPGPVRQRRLAPHLGGPADHGGVTLG